MVKRTITITTFFLILTMVVSLIVILNKSSFAADDDIASGTSGTCSWVIDSEGVLTIRPINGIEGTLDRSGDYNVWPWTNYKFDVKKVIVSDTVNAPNSLKKMFYMFKNCTQMDLSGLNTSSVTNMSQMFFYCQSLRDLNMSGWDVSNVTDMGGIFALDSRLNSLDLSSWNAQLSVMTVRDRTKPETNSEYTIHGLFTGCSSLKSLDLSNIDTSNVKSFSSMFKDCKLLESLNISSWSMDSLVTQNSSQDYFMTTNFFNECNNLKQITIGTGFNFGININPSTYYCDKFPSPSGNEYSGKWIRTDDFGPFTSEEIRDALPNTSYAGTWVWERVAQPYAVLTEDDTLCFVRGIKQDENSSTGIVTSLSGVEITGRIFNINEASTNNNNRTWSSIGTQVKKVAFLDEIKPKNTSYWFHAFYNCTEMNLTKLNTSEVTNMDFMFNDCGSLRAIDVSNFNTSNVTTMDHLFNGCANLTTIDVSNFDVSNVTNLACLFNFCAKLKSINVSGWDVSSATNINHMFRCESLETLDISSFDTSNATYMVNMLSLATSLKTIVLGENFAFEGRNISNVSNRAIFPTPPTSLPNTGKWIRSDYAFGPYTPEELRDNYTSSMAGTWKWESIYSVSYSYNSVTGASELPEERFYREGEEVTVAPDATATGYTFSGWSRTGTFNMPAEDVEITGSFTERTDIPYKVEHYLEDLNADTYSLAKTDNLTGTIYTEVVANANDYEGFTFDNSIDGTKTSGNIEGDGSLVLKLYYKRNSYNVSYSYTGDVPEDASALPPQQTYEYGAEINVPEDSTAEGYRFSGWIKDYITMPAQDIEITGYFIENPKSYSYKVEYFFDGELDETLEEILNAEKDEEISITPQTPLKHGEKNYTLVSDNHKIIVTVNDEDNIIKVYYETDVLDYEIDNIEDTIEGDGISDKYQIKITYKVENGSWDDGTKEIKTDIITLRDEEGNYSEGGTGNTTIPQVGNKPSKGYTAGNWNKMIPSKVSSKDNENEYIYSYEKVAEADIAKPEGKSSNPKTADVFHRYLINCALGISTLMIVVRIRRKYSRKVSKVQY